MMESCPGPYCLLTIAFTMVRAPISLGTFGFRTRGPPCHWWFSFTEDGGSQSTT